jgi:hypothetical protein
VPYRDGRFRPLGAQASGRQPAPPLPRTPAGDELRAWLDAYNDGDHPITHANWEGSGIEPDVAVPAARALDTVLVLLKNAPR